MTSFHPILFYLTVIVLAAIINALPQSDTSFDPTDLGIPSTDVFSFPETPFTFPDPVVPDPFPNGIPTLPDVCDPQNFTEDCLQILKNYGDGAYLWFERGHVCTPQQVQKLKMGFWNAEEILHSAARLAGHGDDEDPDEVDFSFARYWMGEDWIEYKERLKGNLRRASEFINHGANAKSYITVNCKDPKGYCALKDPKNDKKVIGGYAWDQKWWGYTYGHIEMCATFFDGLTLTETQGLLRNYQDRKDDVSMRLMSNYAGLGQNIVHEMMHLGSTYGSEPKITDRWLACRDDRLKTDRDKMAYGPKRAWCLAHDKCDVFKDPGDICEGAAFTTTNADNYAMLANALYWFPITDAIPYADRSQARHGSTGFFPHVSLDDGADFSVESVGDQLDQIVSDYMSHDDEADDNGDLEDPSQTDGTTQSFEPATPVSDQNSCHGINGDYWIMSRDVAVDSVNRFCNQHDQTVRYNQGTINELELSVKKVDDDGSGPQDSPDCVGRFVGAVIDGCDGGDEINNPWNYKFGSTLTTRDGWTYTMTPLSQNVNEVSCDISYRFWDNYVEIRGKNVPFNNLGAWGLGLLDNLRGCGVVTGWKFEFTPDDCCFQWYAAGAMPALEWIPSCIGDALQSAGGSGPGNCKRQVVGSNAIDNWPGYGDDAKHVFGPDAYHEKRDNINSCPGMGYEDEGKHVFGNEDLRS